VRFPVQTIAPVMANPLNSLSSGGRESARPSEDGQIQFSWEGPSGQECSVEGLRGYYTPAELWELRIESEKMGLCKLLAKLPEIDALPAKIMAEMEPPEKEERDKWGRRKCSEAAWKVITGESK